MNWLEISDLIKLVCDKTKDYNNIRSDWNLWMAIQWFAILEASKNIEKWLIELWKSIEKIEININNSKRKNN